MSTIGDNSGTVVTQDINDIYGRARKIHALTWVTRLVLLDHNDTTVTKEDTVDRASVIVDIAYDMSGDIVTRLEALESKMWRDKHDGE